MRKKINKTLMSGSMLLAVFIMLSINLSAQNNSNASGGNATGSNGTVSYSVGQLTNQVYTGTTGSISEGVQQPFEISVVNGIDDAADIQLNAIIYPNPTTDFIQLKIEKEKWIGTYYALYDQKGNMVKSDKINDKVTTIEMKSFAASAYFVKVFNNMSTLKTFKVIKTQ
jgi:hypothetical protein